MTVLTDRGYFTLINRELHVARVTRTAAGWSIAAVALTVAFVITLYWFFITVGHGEKIPRQTWFYSLQAEAFLDGQLHLLLTPSQEFLARARPLNATNTPPWLYDASFYKGRFYMYWGPVPALLLAVYKLVTQHTANMGDGRLVLVFTIARLVIGAALLLMIQKHLFPRMRSALLLTASLALFGLSTPYLFTLGRPAVYEAAIESGQAFLLLGLLAAFASAGAETRRRELSLLFLAGSSWIAAAGCRISLAPAAIVLVAWTALIPLRGRAGRWPSRLLAVGSPVALGLGLLAVYNFARFDSWKEFGLTYQLNPVRLKYSLSFWPANLHAYFVRRVVVSCQFPFIDAPSGAVALLPSIAHLKSGYVPLEPVVGLLTAAPVIVFGSVTIASGLRTLQRTRWLRRALPPDALRVWIVGALLLSVLMPLLPLLGLYTSSMRYLADFASGALLLAICGFWKLSSSPRVQGAWLRASYAVGVLLAAYTVVFSVLLGFQGGYYRSFKKLNPALHDKLSAALSCKG
ncbi:MAG TPA: hypothetical protein VI072_14195 [Polyangiaceae bacterium]